MAVSKEDVIEFIANMTVLELSELIKELEDKFGVSAAAPVAVAAVAAPGEGAAAVEEKTEFDVILTSEDFDKSKPDPDCYLKAAQQFEFQPDECVGFEDSINGVKALNAAKMFVVGLATTNQPDALEPWCNLIVDDFTHLDLNVLLAEQGK